jgi:hypothetical protein
MAARQNEMKVSMSEVATATLIVRPAWEVEGVAMRYPPCREIEPGHPPAPLRAALEIHLVHVYWGLRGLSFQYHSPLLNSKLYVVHHVFQYDHQSNHFSLIIY